MNRRRERNWNSVSLSSAPPPNLRNWIWQYISPMYFKKLVHLCPLYLFASYRYGTRIRTLYLPLLRVYCPHLSTSFLTTPDGSIGNYIRSCFGESRDFCHLWRNLRPAKKFVHTAGATLLHATAAYQFFYFGQCGWLNEGSKIDHTRRVMGLLRMPSYQWSVLPKLTLENSCTEQNAKQQFGDGERNQSILSLLFFLCLVSFLIFFFKW